MQREPRLTKRERRAANIPENEVISWKLGGRTVPVPYVAAWSSEYPVMQVRPEPLMGGRLALFRGGGRRGEGEPLFGKMDVGRQRRCILRGICQVCGEPIEGPRWVALLMEKANLPGVGDLDVVREPPACTLCMRTALRVCPGLRRDQPLIVEPTRTSTLITLTVPPIGGRGPLNVVGPEMDDPKLEDTVVGYLKLVVHGIQQRFEMRDFLLRFS